MNKQIKLGLVGLGSFGRTFAPLFASHPQVSSVGLCDAVEERIRWVYEDPRITPKVDKNCMFTSFDEMCKSDVDALVIITQPSLHAPQIIKGLEHGKDVCSAVPVISLPDDDETMDWCAKIIECEKRTGKRYMLGETTAYRPQTMFCRRMAKQGLFGDFVFAEAEYAHDLDDLCSLRQVQETRSTGKIGAEIIAAKEAYLRRGCFSHPMNYPTHSVSGPILAMETLPVKVSAYGHRNSNSDPYFEGYDFSDIVAFFQLANGCSLRVAEMREIVNGTGLYGEDFRIFGTRGSYSLNHWRENGRTAPEPEKTPKPVSDRELTLEEMRDELPPEVAEAFYWATQHPSRATEMHRALAMGSLANVKDFTPEGHGGSHPYLVHEFVSATAEGREYYVNSRIAATFMAMGIAAHKSAQKDGELIKVETF